MAGTLADIYAVSNDVTFQQRVSAGCYITARQILNESSSTTGHEQRYNFARSIIVSSIEQFRIYAALVCTDSAVLATIAAGDPDQSVITDGQIGTALTNIWNKLAGVPDS